MISFSKQKESFYKKEERRLKNEILQREQQLNNLRAKSADESKKRAAESSASVHRFKKSNYPSYVVSAVRENSLFGIVSRFFAYFRRFRLVSTIVKTVSAVFAIVQAGALLIILSGVLIVVIPALIVFAVTAFVLTFVTRRKITEKAEKVFSGRPLTVIFVSHTAPSLSCVYATARDLAAAGQAVLVVLPTMTSKRTQKKIDGVLTVKHHMYFHLQSHVLKNAPDRTEIYL